MKEELVPRATDYKSLLCYQKADTVYQMTVYFANKFIRRGDRTQDQMVQAARSGKQNIIEGCEAAPTSIKTQIKLVNVAKASLKELLEDYEDYLKVKNITKWEPESKEYEAMRDLGRQNNDPQFFMELIQTRPPETIANMAIILINQADYLIYKFLKRIEADFMEEGGFSERMMRLRRDTRKNKQ